MEAPVTVTEGDSPLILATPHAGTFIPTEIQTRLNETGRVLADTDWHVDRLYEGLAPDATFIKANFHRYVIDANRSPDDELLYPGQNTTSLVPLTDFDGDPIWNDDAQPNTAEIEERRKKFHAPYHAEIERAIARTKETHGVVVLYDCHSIRSHIPYLFEGELPALNIGTNSGASCHPRIGQLAYEVAASSPYSTVLNGRFKGGWTTRHYGDPANNVHAIQIEIAQRTYMTEAPPWNFDAAKAKTLRPRLKRIFEVIKDEALELAMEQKQ